VTPRYEYKIPCDPLVAPQVEAWVRLHPLHWRVSYPERQVNNVYFDSHDLRDLNANLSGAGPRQKLRLRWYGPELRRAAGAQLELKCKDGLAGWKEVVRFEGSLELGRDVWATLLAKLRAGVEPRARAWLDQRALPVLINCYQRAYYETPDGELRLTLDTNLRAYDQRWSLAPNLEHRALQPEQMVMELKGPVTDESGRRLSQVLAGAPMRLDRFSKYLRGMLAGPDFEGVVV